MTRRGPHDLLLALRGRCPPLARRLDGAAGVSLTGGELRVKVAEGSWFHRELIAWGGALQGLAGEVLAPGTEVVLDLVATPPPGLPLPVASTKVWNHVAFWALGPVPSVVALRKPRYVERWLPLEGAPEGWLAESLADPEVFAKRYAPRPDLPPGETPETWCLPELLEDLCRLGREAASYVQILLPFPGDAEAERLEGRLHAVKEWGTPEVPGPVLQKYVGRLHYLAPDARPVGLRACGFVSGQD